MAASRACDAWRTAWKCGLDGGAMQTGRGVRVTVGAAVTIAAVGAGAAAGTSAGGLAPAIGGGVGGVAGIVGAAMLDQALQRRGAPVSYTHLTLPTKRIV